MRERARSSTEEHPEEPIATEKKDILEIGNFRMFNAEGERTSHLRVTAKTSSSSSTTREAADETADLLLHAHATPKSSRSTCPTSRTRTTRSTREIGKHHLRVRLKNPSLLAGEYLLSGELWNNDAGFYINHSRKRPITIQQGEFIGTGITHVDYELEND